MRNKNLFPGIMETEIIYNNSSLIDVLIWKCSFFCSYFYIWVVYIPYFMSYELWVINLMHYINFKRNNVINDSNDIMRDVVPFVLEDKPYHSRFKFE